MEMFKLRKLGTKNSHMTDISFTRAGMIIHAILYRDKTC